jgi:hypothetical protein
MQDPFKEGPLSTGATSFDDTAHYFGIESIETSEDMKGLSSMQLTYREDGQGQVNGYKARHKETFQLYPDEEITSLTVSIDAAEERVKWINFNTTAGRAISMGQDDGTNSEERMEATYEAPSADWILGGIHGSLKDDRKSRLSSLGVYWVKKSNVRAIRGGNILIGVGSAFLADDDATITQQVLEITSIAAAVEWIRLDLIKNPRNPVIMWQINPFNPFLVLHRRRFLEQELDGITNAKDFVEGTVAMVEAAQATTISAEGKVATLEADQTINNSDPTTAFYVVGASCASGEGGIEGLLCVDGSDCCSGLCNAESCVHCLPELTTCDTDLDCCEDLYCTDQLCIVRPENSKHLCVVHNWFTDQCIVLLSHSITASSK